MRQMSGKRFLERVRDFGQRSEGSTAIEYAMVASFMAVALIAAMATLGQSVAATFDKVSAALEGSADMPSPTTAAGGATAPAGSSATPSPP